MNVIKLKDKKGNDFLLYTRKAEDCDFRVSRAAIIKAINKAKRDPYLYSYLIIFNYTHSSLFVRRPFVSVALKGKTIRLGCHEFNVANTKKILRWAGVK